ncbi:MAG TPA: dihydrolipoyl dehydrogenase [Thermotogota bacterium]|jgi:dihydrolipoamide dehydrogenase|nr:dihydrolipoyl dehydrogenase [Thermotogota bacterium]NLH20491.1 dihydrolipoyl dehydrogenase [Thermotogaceae bacterium]OQC32234.1 MAG: Dihydrolipoyl dehydrogenase [Thermotogota bacterium ADurb.Bin062]HNW47251.1 dihydrolipoyl dehydrogenase [Thermotogota bacterium]HNY82345.1 dihydrolipoyl dehydrogenase [Thermotogota bacterium]
MTYDLIVVGSGPAGYTGAIRARQLGLRTAIIEMDKPGGVCLNVGCIPTKALIHKAKEFRAVEGLKAHGLQVDASRFDFSGVTQYAKIVSTKLSKSVAFLLKKAGVDTINGRAKFISPTTLEVSRGEEREVLTGRHFLIATGSRPKNLPGLVIDEERILSSTGALFLKQLPKRIAIIGAGAIGVEFAYIYRSFGSEVDLIEVLPRILPLEDSEAVDTLTKRYIKLGIQVLPSTRVLEAQPIEEGVRLTIQKQDGAQETLTVDKVLLAVGRTLNTDQLGLENIPLTTERGFLRVNSRYQTAVPHIYAAGDVIPTPLLAHVASEEAINAVESIVDPQKEPIDFSGLIPSCIYSEPELASFGDQEAQLVSQNRPFKKTVFPYRGIGKSVATDQPEGFIKLLSDPETERVLGATIVGAQATELIHEYMLLKRTGQPIRMLAHMIHAHPTLSEGMMEAAKLALGEAINL